MVTKQGKVKSISISEVTEGMQVFCQGLIFIIKAIFDKDRPVIYGKNNHNKIVHKEMHISELKTLIVEYEGEKRDYSLDSSYTKKFKAIHLPLKYSQWQAAIDNEEVDSEKTVNFEIKEYHSPNDNSVGLPTGIKYAKINPQRIENILPSEEEQLERLGNLLTSHDVRRYLNINGFGYSQIERDIVKLFNTMLKP